MVKKTTTKPKKTVEKKAAVEEVPEVEHSEAVLEKIANSKRIQKQNKAMKAFVGDKIDSKQILKAVQALQKYCKAKKSAASQQLLNEEDESIHVTFTLGQLPKKPSVKPLMIVLPHPFNCEEKHHRVCVFSTDPARALKDQLLKVEVPCIAKVIGIDKLRRNFKQYKDKRALLKDYDAFLADLRVYKMLPECLGKSFYTSKKFPCPIKLHGLSDEELAAKLNEAANSTHFMQGNGPNYSVHVGNTSQKAKDVAANAQEALEKSLSQVTVWDDIDMNQLSQITMSVTGSPELPIFNFLADEDLKTTMS